ncbi:NAD-dependent succinate-semialdehyde dehydrogenase [Sphingopyxis sp. 113P3]|uniref:NAD-dependent succinate-semialdehyde dehydrogenase n=1 Tax=Sphingopyxis sp. (strain 113P3) TaxID=292913 RepID=UPI0006AD5BCD|nr:NAD-dependent succinate-semialdehyde dehydrogenase [Sphingopyxis sp. 113P3]ALC12434.1 succinate-semialdehyde dehydrogenase [Sphingopyxis sp. 113P3]
MSDAWLSRPDLLRTEGFIAGRWEESDTRYDVLNPATGACLARVTQHGAEAATRAVDAASAALAAWSATTASERAAILRRWHELVLESAEDLARLMTAEQGKPLAEARGEVAYAASFLLWFAEEARRVYGSVIPGNAPTRRLTVIRQPVGVVAAITPWNFPAAMITRKVAPALAVGCTVVLKPSELTPLSALALAHLGAEAGVPPGVFNVVSGEAPAIGEVLTGDPRVRKFSFTGSTAVGKMLAAKCMATVKRVSLELGGNAPFIVFDDADIDAAVSGAIASKFRNSGQTCVCANRFLVQDGIYDRFAAALARKVGMLNAGDGLAGASDQGPLINAAAVAKVERHCADAVERGARILARGQVSGPPEGHFARATLLVDVAPDALLVREETFGPLAGLIRFDHEEEAIRLANDTPAGLAAYLFTADHSRATRVSEALEYGMVGLNTGLISTEVAPFGGIKESGFGREGSQFGIDDYVSIKLVVAEIAPA